FYADLKYQTPGGLTLDQFKQDPVKARSIAVEQNAGVRNRTFYGGVLHEVKMGKNVRQMIAVFTSHTNFENPFITNYETRIEDNAGSRTWFEYENKDAEGIKLVFNFGAEGQVMKSKISNYGNNGGFKDTVQAIDDLTASQGFIFSRAAIDFYNRWILESSLSYNLNYMRYERLKPAEAPFGEHTFRPQLMPRVALSYLVNLNFAIRAIVSKGYSPPTLQEVRASDNTFNKNLEAESGWN